jgi:hypothetical protein
MESTRSGAEVTVASGLPRYINEKDVASCLGVSIALLRKLRLKGGGPPFVKISKCVRYEVEALTRWMSERAAKE